MSITAAFSWLLRLFGLTPSSFLGSRPLLSEHLPPAVAGGGFSPTPYSHAAEPPLLPPARHYPPAMPPMLPRSVVPSVFHLVCTLPGKQLLPPEIQVGVVHSVSVCDLFSAAASGTEFHYGLELLLCCVFYGTLLGDTRQPLRRSGFQHSLTQPLPIHIPQGFGSPGLIASIGVIMDHSRCLLLLRVQMCSYEIRVQIPVFPILPVPAPRYFMGWGWGPQEGKVRI